MKTNEMSDEMKPNTLKWKQTWWNIIHQIPVYFG